MLLVQLRINQESLALWADGFTFVVSALLVGVGRLPAQDGRSRCVEEREAQRVARPARGLAFIGSSPRVRAVMLGIGAGLFGGGMLVPLGRPSPKKTSAAARPASVR